LTAGFGAKAAATTGLDSPGSPAEPGFAHPPATVGVKTGSRLDLGNVSPRRSNRAIRRLWRLRLPRVTPPRPLGWPVSVGAPLVAIVPVYDEAETIATVISQLPQWVNGPLGRHRVVTVVIDDGSNDGSGDLAAAAGALVVRHQRNLGLGAALRRGLAEACALDPAAVVYLDADLEYDPAQLAVLAEPVLWGAADYVVGSRFSGRIERMPCRRRFGNRVLTVWVRWMTRRADLTDGQSGYRAFSAAAAAAAEVVHDYNYAQVLTLDLLGKGFLYTEVPIRYAFRSSGESFVRVGTYLRKVIPAVYGQLNS
jgi:glycosyltransferase involved in cell wall biosynthesis